GKNQFGPRLHGPGKHRLWQLECVMATDAQNLKISRVTVAGKTAFSSATLASGSIYWDESEKRVVVGDGVTAGGVGMAKESEVTDVAALRTEVNAIKSTSLPAKLDTSELETALKELIVEFGGTVPQ
ncbi:MAG: hypothetical protein ACLSU5_11460, partial [Sutterella wadsworthensis]